MPGVFLKWLISRIPEGSQTLPHLTLIKSPGLAKQNMRTAEGYRKCERTLTQIVPKNSGTLPWRETED